jgi:hypothetical protein
LAPGKLMFSTMMRDDGPSSFLTEKRSFSSFATPEPLPAVAYDYEDPYDDETDHETTLNSSSEPGSGRFSAQHHHHGVNSSKFLHDVTSRKWSNSEILSATRAGSSSGRGQTTSTTYPPPSSVNPTTTKAAPRKYGGGGGRHRCPKCGTHVTFRHGDFEENTFYCATCSGWFVANDNTIMGEGADKGDGSPYDEFVAKKGTKNHPEEHHIVMQDVSIICSFGRSFFFWTKILRQLANLCFLFNT